MGALNEYTNDRRSPVMMTPHETRDPQRGSAASLGRAATATAAAAELQPSDAINRS